MCDDTHAFDECGFTLTQDPDLGHAIDKIVGNFKQKKPITHATLDLWAENFGFGNKDVRNCLNAFEKPWHFAGYTWLGRHNSPGLHALLVTKNQSPFVGMIAVVGFGPGSTFTIERGSHRRQTRPADDTLKTLSSGNGVHVSTRPSIKIDPASVAEEALVQQHWAGGGRMIADPRIHWHFESGEAVVFLYVQDVSKRDPISFPAGLEEVVKKLENEDFKIHAKFKESP